MCDGTDAQKDLQNNQIDFYKQLMAQDKTAFGQDQNIFNRIYSTYAPILEAGPNQRGFSDAERNDMNTDAMESTAKNYAGATRAFRNQTAAMGGGNTYIPSGAAASNEADLAARAADTLSTGQRQIEQADYQTGRQNFLTATQALENQQAQLNPTGYAGAATGAGSAASKTAKDIADEGSSWYAPLIGAASGVASGYLSGRGKS